MNIKNLKLRKNEKEYIPRYPEKYVGRYPIITRSSWEYKACLYFDYNPKVSEWSSEEHVISYIDPVDGKPRRYYPDYYAKVRGNRFIVEVKPKKDLKPPVVTKGKSKKTIGTQMETYERNKAKFKSAELYCEKMGFKFVVLTEKELFRDKK